MRTLFPVLLIMGIAVAGLMFGMSGFNDGWGTDPGALEQPADRFNQTANDSSINSGVESTGNQDATIVGYVLSGGKQVLEVARMVVLLPVTLISMGFPPWFALPVGAFVEIWAGIGVLQFIVGRVYR